MILKTVLLLLFPLLGLTRSVDRSYQRSKIYLIHNAIELDQKVVEQVVTGKELYDKNDLV